MNYAECLNYLADLGHELRRTAFSLGPISGILSSLGNPHQRYPTAVIAGTNGKGSTSAILASILECAGYRTGLYTSPHLVRVNERMSVNGREIPDDDFAWCFTEIQKTADQLLHQGSLPHRPSFFEFLTATAFLYFARSRVNFAVLEVGMGGRLDATNVTEPRVAVITNVDLDHVEFLGSTHAAIAREKAGVIKQGRPVISGCEQGDAADVIRRRCAEVGAELIEISSFAHVSGLQSLWGRYIFDLTLNGDCFSQLRSPLLGKFQLRNAVLAATAAWRLGQEGCRIPRAAIVEGLRKTTWPGRLEVWRENPLVLLDGAHNPAAAREIAAFVREHHRGRAVRLVYASMRDKAIGEISEVLFPLAEEVYLTRPNHPRAASGEEIVAAARFRPGRIFIEPEPARALERACHASDPEGLVLATGSLFLVGAIKKARQEGNAALT